jgi:hypothetical protein
VQAVLFARWKLGWLQCRSVGDLLPARGVWEDVAGRGWRGGTLGTTDDALPASGAWTRFELRRWWQEQDRRCCTATDPDRLPHTGYRRRWRHGFSLHASSDDALAVTSEQKQSPKLSYHTPLRALVWLAVAVLVL